MASTSGTALDADQETEILESTRRKLIKGITDGSWGDVVEEYKHSRAHKIQIDISGNTALHVAVTSGREDTVEELVQLIRDCTENNAWVVLSMKNKKGENPLHLAAKLGNIAMCRCIIGDQYGGLLDTRTAGNLTPLFLAALNGKKDAFFWLYDKCDPDKVLEFCHDDKGVTVLYAAIQLGFWDMAFQIIHRQESLVDSVNVLGNSPLHLLAEQPTAFRSGIYLSFFKNIIYHCIQVEKLIPETFKEKKEPILPCPNNHQTRINFCQELWKMIKSSVLVISGKCGRKSNKQLDTENPEEGQGHHLNKGAQGHQGSPSRYGRCLKFIKLNVSKILLVIFSIIPGSSEIRKLKEKKEQHVWSLQIMNILIERAKKCTNETNPQNHETSHIKYCYSEYEYFTRGQARITPILYAAKNGVIEMVEKILQDFPMTTLDRDRNGNNIVMMAAECRQSHVYDFLLRSSYIADKALTFGRRNDNWDTAMHKTAELKNYEGWLIPTGIFQMQWEVKWYEYVKESLSPDPHFMERNNQAKSPGEIFIENHKELLIKSKEWLDSICNPCTVIATLLTTVAITSSATIPGGPNQHTGKPIFQDHLAFRLFSISSLVALCSSLISLLVFFTLLTSKHQYEDFSKKLPRTFTFGLTSLFISMAAMLLCFGSRHFLMLEDRFKYAAISIYALTCLAIAYFALQHFASYFVLMIRTFQKVPERIYKEVPL